MALEGCNSVEKLLGQFRLLSSKEKRLLLFEQLALCDTSTWFDLQSWLSKNLHGYDFFTILPNNIISRVLSYLGPKDVRNMLLVCMSWSKRTDSCNGMQIAVRGALTHLMPQSTDPYSFTLENMISMYRLIGQLAHGFGLVSFHTVTHPLSGWDAVLSLSASSGSSTTGASACSAIATPTQIIFAHDLYDERSVALKTITLPSGPPISVVKCLSGPNCYQVLYGSSHGVVRRSDVMTGELLATYMGHPAVVVLLDASQDYDTLLSCSLDHIRVRTLSTGTMIACMTEDLCFPSGSTAHLWPTEGGLLVVVVTPREHRAEFFTVSIYAINRDFQCLDRIFAVENLEFSPVSPMALAPNVVVRRNNIYFLQSEILDFSDDEDFAGPPSRMACIYELKAKVGPLGNLQFYRGVYGTTDRRDEFNPGGIGCMIDLLEFGEKFVIALGYDGPFSRMSILVFLRRTDQNKPIINDHDGPGVPLLEFVGKHIFPFKANLVTWFPGQGWVDGLDGSNHDCALLAARSSFLTEDRVEFIKWRLNDLTSCGEI